MKRILCMAVSMLLVLVVAGSVPVSASDVRIPDVIKKMQDKNSEIQDMKCLFVKNVFKNGKIIPETTMTFKYMKNPETLFVEFINRKKGQKCLYVRGQNDDKLIVRPPGLMSFLTVKVDPKGEKAMAESLNPMTGMDFGSILTNFEKFYNSAVQKGTANINYVEDINQDGRLCNVIKIDSKTNKSGYYYMYIDKEHHLPYKIRYEFQGNIGDYTYKNLEINPNLNKDDFKV